MLSAGCSVTIAPLELLSGFSGGIADSTCLCQSLLPMLLFDRLFPYPPLYLSRFWSRFVGSKLGLYPLFPQRCPSDIRFDRFLAAGGMRFGFKGQCAAMCGPLHLVWSCVHLCWYLQLELQSFWF